MDSSPTGLSARIAQLESELADREAILEFAGQSIYCIDSQGNCSYINAEASRMLGYSREECVGRDMHRLIHHTRADGSHYPIEECPIYTAATKDEGVRIDHEIVWRRDGVGIPVEYTAQSVQLSGERRGVVVTMLDITNRVAAERMLREKALLAALAIDVGLAITEGPSLAAMLSLCTDALVRHLGATFARVWTLNEHEAVLELQASSGMYTHINGAHARVPVGQFKIGNIASSRLPHLTNDVQHDPRVGDREWARREGMVSFAGYPLLVDNDLVGVMALFAKHHLDKDVLDALASVAYSISVGIERKHNEAALRANEALKTAILDTALDCIVTIDENSRIIEFNPAAEKTFGYPRADVLGRPMPELMIPPALRPAHYDGLRRYLASGDSILLGKRIEVTAIRSDGSEFPIELALNRIPGTGPARFTATLRDITARKRTEEDLRAAKDAAESASKAKSQFLAGMSHQLRTPLNAIIGYSEMVQEELPKIGASALVADLSRINGAGRDLLALISDILDLAKIDAGRMDLYFQNIDVASLIRDAAQIVQPLMAKYGNQFTVEPGLNPGQMYADATKVRQILLNLLSNAAKFTRNGGVSLRCQPEADALIFSVNDNGTGIAEDRITELFQPFSQLTQSSSRPHGGSGLGLPLTRYFVEMMGGRISVETQLGKGSCFTVWLPRHSVAHAITPEIATPPEPGVNDSRPTVLVIDDDPAARDQMQRHLTAQGMRAVLAANGEQGLELARRLKPQLITLDVIMPGLDGWAVLQAMKSDPLTADVPVIMTTIVGDRGLGYALGAADYLIKPVSHEKLAEVLARFCAAPVPGPVGLGGG